MVLSSDPDGVRLRSPASDDITAAAAACGRLLCVRRPQRLQAGSESKHQPKRLTSRDPEVQTVQGPSSPAL